MNKKAFTIVELAIVLVVIGIIMAMAVKGRAFVRTAKIRQEIAKFYKYEVAFNTYYTRFASLPTITERAGAARIDEKLLLEMGLLTTEDLNTDYLSPNYKWGFSAFTLVPNTGNPNFNVYRHYMKGNIVVAQPMTKASEQGIGFQLELVCYLESYMDDSSMFGGQGRMVARVNTGTDPVRFNYADALIPYYKDCSKSPYVGGGYDPNNQISYGYRVF